MQHICEIQCYSVYFHKLCNLGYKNCKSYVQTQQFVIVIWLPLMEHEIPVLPDHLVSIHLPSGAPEFTPGFQWDSCYSIFSFICMFCRSLFVLLYFLFWPLCCLFVFDIRILIAPLVSSNSSYASASGGHLLANPIKI